MASKSRAAQQALSELEKSSAQFEDQLVEAAKFIGSEIDAVSAAANSQKEGTDIKKVSASHGKEEWLLKWLLKKLQTPKDDVPRKISLSWNLVLLILQRLPLPVAARILGERKFVAILQKTLEEVKQRPVEDLDTTKPSSLDEKETKKSKKRKRSGEAAVKSSVLNGGVESLLAGILAVVDFIVDSTKPNSGKADNERDSEFSAEYMRTVLRSSAEDSAKLMGVWLQVLKKHDILSTSGQMSWLSSFVEIWQLHIADENHLTHFSLHCTLPLLSLLGNLSGSSSFGTQIEQLLARNIVIPSKAAKEENVDSTLLNDLTKIAVLSDSANASRLFEIAIRSIQPQGAKRRRTVDEAWLQVVFSSLKSSMAPKRVEQNGKAVCAMVQSAILHKVDLELEVLRSVTADYAIPKGGETSWELLRLVIKLDTNVFLIPNTEQDLLRELLTRVNQISVVVLDIPEMVVEDVILPLMEAFAKARDLTGFMHHWLAQLVEVETTRKASSSSNSEIFGVWEDSRLQNKLKELLESSLSVNQIVQLLDWLELEIVSNPGPVSVILQAISASIDGEEVVDTVNLKCYHVMFDNNISDSLDARYQWRSWSILANTLSFANREGIEELAGLWAKSVKPFDSLASNASPSKLIDIHSLEISFVGLEVWKFACAAWSNAKDGSKMQQLAKPLVLDLLRKVNLEAKVFLHLAATETDVKQLTTWRMSRFAKCLFMDYPQILVLAAELQGAETRELMNVIFWIASASDSGHISKSDLVEPSNFPDPIALTFAEIWMSALKADCILNTPAVAEMMVDIMLDNESYAPNLLVRTNENNLFAVKSLLQVPISTLHRKHRECIMKAWATAEFEDAPSLLDPTVLALKIKTMRFPMFYEGMDFQQLSSMASALANTNTPDLLVSLGLFKTLAELTLEFVFTNIGQVRNQEYTKDAFNYVQKIAKKAHKHTKHDTSFASIALFEVILESIRVNSKALFETGALRGKDVTKIEALVQHSLLAQLQNSLELLSGEEAEWNTNFVVVVILDTFTTLGLGLDQVQDLKESAKHLRGGEDEYGIDLRSLFDAFLASQMTEDSNLVFEDANSSTILGRRSIKERAQLVIDAENGNEKLKMVKSVLQSSTSSSPELGQLLALRQLILSVEDTRKSKKRSALSDSDSSDEEGDTLDLSETYSQLCGQLQKTKSVRHFCLISETLEAMLRTKARSISQWNIDSTLGCISAICSRNSPSLRASRGSTIYIHVCHLFQAILLSHRLKLEGHFHLVIQAIQSLLRCLFIPLPYSSTKALKHFAPPSWLNTTPSTYPLDATHATAFTRLITLICDPSVSSVTRSSHNNLTSATDKAKRMAGQHMQFVLMSYIRLQLEMKMLPAMREKMIPGIYAIFDTTTIESRRCISESLDSSGRAVFGMLYKDYIRFGKWKGS